MYSSCVQEQHTVPWSQKPDRREWVAIFRCSREWVERFGKILSPEGNLGCQGLPLDFSLLNIHVFGCLGETKVHYICKNIADTVGPHIIWHFFLWLNLKSGGNSNRAIALKSHRYFLTKIIPCSCLRKPTQIEIDQSTFGEGVCTEKMLLLLGIS